MLTANRIIFIFILIASAVAVHGQAVDTIQRIPFERYWTKSRLVPKFGAGIQGSALVEAGFAYHKIFVHPFTLASAGPYLTCDVVILDNSVIVGPKLGYELTVGLIGLATDVTYYSDFERESVLITPKAGLTLLGFANLFYGRSLALSDDSFTSVSVNRFTLVINFNRDYFDLREARRARKKQ